MFIADNRERKGSHRGLGSGRYARLDGARVPAQPRAIALPLYIYNAVFLDWQDCRFKNSQVQNLTILYAKRTSVSR